MFELRKSGFVRRISAWFLDAILLAVLTTGFLYVFSLICNFSGEQALAREYYAEWEEFREEYIPEVAAHFGFTYEIDEESELGYVAEKDGEIAYLDDIVNALAESNGEDEAVAEAYEAYLALPPAGKVNAQYEYLYNLLFTMVSLALFSAYLVLEFILPILFKNGQTVGKKVFSICLVRPDCVKISNLSLFARSVLGKYAIETMFPVLLVFLFLFGGLGLLAIILLGAILLLNTILFFATKNRTPIHDLLAGTVAADMRLQMIYRSEDELNERKALLHKESVERSES